MNEYERLIADEPVSDNTYKYGDRDVTPQELYLCLMIEESVNQLNIDDVAAVVSIIRASARAYERQVQICNQKHVGSIADLPLGV